MSDIVVVALLGVSGTLVAGFVGPWSKAWADSWIAGRSARRKRIGELLASIYEGLRRMQGVEKSSSGWWQEHAAVVSLIAELSLVLPRGSEGIANVLELLSNLARREDHSLDAMVTSSTVSAGMSMTTDWYRGRRKAKDMLQELADYDGMMREHFVADRQASGSEPAAKSDDQPD